MSWIVTLAVIAWVMGALIMRAFFYFNNGKNKLAMSQLGSCVFWPLIIVVAAGFAVFDRRR